MVVPQCPNCQSREIIKAGYPHLPYMRYCRKCALVFEPKEKKEETMKTLIRKIPIFGNLLAKIEEAIKYGARYWRLP